MMIMEVMEVATVMAATVIAEEEELTMSVAVNAVTVANAAIHCQAGQKRTNCARLRPSQALFLSI
jgi:hypothetical protein